MKALAQTLALIVSVQTGVIGNENTWRAQIARALHLPDTLPAVATETHGRFAPDRDVVAERISYATLYGMRVPAVLYLPRDHELLRRQRRQRTALTVAGRLPNVSL